MPPIEKHMKTSLDRTGKDYREIHEWLDSDSVKKAERHDITKIYEYGQLFRERYGDEALQEYIWHIHDDLKAKFEHIQEDFKKAIDDNLAYFGVKGDKS